MNITILTDNLNSWVQPYVDILKQKIPSFHTVNHIFKQKDIKQGDLLLILGCEKIINQKYLLLNKNNIVVHPSELPKGKGFSPLAWQILEGKNKITLSLFEAVEEVDSGDIYLQDQLCLEGHELNEEIKDMQGRKTIDLILRFITIYPKISGKKQIGKETFYKRRKAKDLEIDPKKSIEEQFNLFRIADNERYPIFFNFKNIRYNLKIFKED